MRCHVADKILREKCPSFDYLQKIILQLFQSSLLCENDALSLFSIYCVKLKKKIVIKVSFNFATEASYVYILFGQKLIKKDKNSPFWRMFKNLKLAVKQCYQIGHF